MNAIVLPKELEAWAQAEVAAGRAESVGDLVATALGAYRDELEDLRRSLDEAEAEAERDGWLDADVVFEEIKARLSGR
ncbi:MAG: hypothetical protein WDM92_13550 [Caulobacteraceae bacterium]